MRTNTIMRTPLPIVAAVMIVSGCTTGDGAQSGETAALIERLSARVAYLEDIAAIERVQSKYAHFLFTQDYGRIFDECYAQQTDDVSLEFSDSGVYRGAGKVREVYEAFEVTKTIPGFFIMHMSVNPYIEVAADGTTARSHWLSPGATGSDASAGWVFGPYYIDYVKEDGEWRIQHSNLAPVVRTSYDVSWAEATDNGTVRGVLGVEPDEPPSRYEPYHEVKQTTDIFSDYPDLPEPY